MFPISDDNPSRIKPYVTYVFIATCVVVFLWQFSLDDKEGERVIYQLGMIPARLFGYDDLPAHLATVPPWATVFSSMFMHGGFMHLGGNMLFLWIFGDNVEDSMGHVKFAAFYVLCGIAAALTQGMLNPDSNIPMVGASGAISGVMGAYILLHPWATIKVIIFFGILFWIANIPALLVLGFWFLAQLFNAAMAPPDVPGVAFWAHAGGFVAGAVLVFAFKDKYVPIWQSARSKPFEVEKRKRPWG